MPPLNDHVASFPAGISITRNAGLCTISPALINLLVTSRQNYDWPAGIGAAISQARIIALEATVCRYLAELSPATSHQIVVAVSDWAGNNANSHANIVAATAAQQTAMHRAIADLLVPATASRGIDALSALPGIRLVIASKIYRFCRPTVGAAVDRHSSYFFNSLQSMGIKLSTKFSREWSSGRHKASRLPIYQDAGYLQNRDENLKKYLPLLSCISNRLNMGGHVFVCAATGVIKNWTPTDVEMAAYYW